MTMQLAFRRHYTLSGQALDHQFVQVFNLLRKSTSVRQTFLRYRVNANQDEYLYGSVSDSGLKLVAPYGFVQLQPDFQRSRVECSRPTTIKFFIFKVEKLFLPMLLCFYIQQRRQFFLTIVCVYKCKHAVGALNQF